MRDALVLAAHGSRRDPGAAQLVRAHADTIRARGLYDEVVAAFHQGEPAFGAVLATLRARRVTVVPLMTAAGHYCRLVLPRALRPAPGQDVHITAPLGTHPALPGLVERRVAALIGAHRLSPRRTAVAVIGHGTPRHRASRDTTVALAQALARARLAADVLVAFLDDDPPLSTLEARLRLPHLVVVPFLVGGSAHALRDLPALLPAQALIGEPVGAYAEVPDLVLELARQARRVSPIPRAPRPGSVQLVGAGPGDPGLITVRGLAALRAADVVVHDRLSAPELLAEAPAAAERIDVGKAPGRAPYTQDEINAILVERARRGLRVVRLKGGDPFVFGRGAEEVAACRAAGISVSTVPGVSSALAGPAAAGIPVTARGVAASLAVVTAHRAGDAALSPGSLTALAGIDTVVVLMGRANLRTFARGLIAAGRAPATPAACVQEATTPRQRAVLGTLASIADLADRERIGSPVVVVVGDVAALAGDAAGAASLAAAGGRTAGSAEVA